MLFVCVCMGGVELRCVISVSIIIMKMFLLLCVHVKLSSMNSYQQFVAAKTLRLERALNRLNTAGRLTDIRTRGGTARLRRQNARQSPEPTIATVLYNVNTILNNGRLLDRSKRERVFNYLLRISQRSTARVCVCVCVEDSNLVPSLSLCMTNNY